MKNGESEKVNQNIKVNECSVSLGKIFYIRKYIEDIFQIDLIYIFSLSFSGRKTIRDTTMSTIWK